MPNSIKCVIIAVYDHTNEVIMKIFTKISLTLALVACIAAPALSVNAPALSVNATAATPTGYTRAEDVKYVKNGDYIYNWGARDEDCVFLSTYAEDFYTGSYVYSVLSQKSGGTSQSNGHQSQLYAALQTLMRANHDHQTSYGETRYQYCYTDCEKGGGKISSFYSGKAIGPSWDGEWNREHTWPNSKGLGGNDENDIMMLRPTATSENSSRGNTAYGEGSSYYDPNCEGQNLRGDCARIMLYTYTRWGNTSKMWGTGGVMQSLDVMLRWMEEDPVDTWEMGRNDAVQAITGTRNVFVDYPEYAWLMFGRAIPTDMVTPSGEAKKGAVLPDIPDDSSSSVVEKPDDSSSSTANSSDSHWMQDCAHEYGEQVVLKEPTEKEDGFAYRECARCGNRAFVALPKTGNGGCRSVVAPIAASLLLSGAFALLRRKSR